MTNFSHLHCHTQFSLLDGAANIGELFKKAKNDGMKGMAITDHGNMFGVFQFVAEAAKHQNAVKPIVGCEFYLVEDRHKRQFSKELKDKRYHQLFLAKNAEGYQNLTKLCSLGFIEGAYGKYPRIDKELVLKYHKGLIATTCCIGAMVPQMILKKAEEAARKEFEWWLDIFGEDYYIELQRHHMPEQEKVNEVLIRWSKEYNVKMICSNDSHYVDQKDYNAHDILLCINTGEKQSTPVIKEFSEEGQSHKGSRFGFWNDQFYFKTQAEMGALFKDHPEALANTEEIVDKVEILQLKKDILLPAFEVPLNFQTQDDYLFHLTYEGARERYKDITPAIKERLDFELSTIRTMGFAGYFLIVADFIKAGRDIGVFVGPGRGSAAGSAVAYCTGITNIDPIKYNLLFERFLNPDRKSMPDIDTDFDDEGRQKVIDYVVKKYGQRQVAAIVTYGTMAAKMSIKDVARVLDLPLQDSNALAKLVPDRPGIELRRVLSAPFDGEKSLKEKEGLQSDDLENCKRLREIMNGDDLQARVLKEAFILEGSVRGTGIHAAGIIIAPKDLTEIIPVCTSKDSEIYVTQYEGSIIEDAGVIKMDFLGLKTLTILRDALALIKENHGIEIEIDNVPLDDIKTYELYQRGDTNGTFQFESPGMQKHLRDLKPDKFEDLIAMNALYRPGPMEYIPNYIARKHGRERVVYDLPEMEEYLSETLGICVFQEQIMLLSQKLAGFSKGDADVLRKAMGKKQKHVLDKMKGQFMEGATAKGLPADKLEKVWTDWEAFAAYAFNKSHSTCYALVAFQTAYLKSHYPGEFMAAVLTNNQSNIEKITFFLDECRKINVPVKGPDVNESGLVFTVNKKGEIRYGLGAIKGVGEIAVENIIQERKENGPYLNIFDFMKRQNLRTVNKKVLESLAFAGAFDLFEDMHRAQFLTPSDRYESFIEHLIKWAGAYQTQKESTENSLFGAIASTVSVPEPLLPKIEPWNLVMKLEKEKEVTGIYISGHPLDDYRIEIQSFTNSSLENLPTWQGRTERAKIAGYVMSVDHRISQKGTGWGRFVIQDYNGSLEITLFSEDYQKFKHQFETGAALFITGFWEKKWNSENWNFKIVEVKHLADIAETLCKAISIKIPITSISNDLIGELDELCTKYKGKNEFKITLIDFTNRNSLPFVASKKKVNAASSDFIMELERLGLEWKVN
ncbi:MAG: DNA polymerase III subunit alpha [Saprospiraceae bacterium]